MKVGELFFSLGIRPDGSWSRATTQVNALRRALEGLSRAMGRAGGGGFGPRFGPGFGPGPNMPQRPIDWSRDTGDPFGPGPGPGVRRRRRPSGDGGDEPKPGFFRQLRRGINDLNLFRRALYGTFAVQTVRTVTDLADTYTNLQNRLRSLTGSQEEADRQFQRGREIATRTRSDLETTLEGFVRVKNATKSMGLTYDDTWTFMERVQKTIKMSGASTVEASQGMRQLTQAMAKGKLDGDEFRSIAESLPDVLRILGEGLGKTEGQIRNMSEEGKLTREVIVQAFTKMGDTIDAKFGKTTQTVGEQFVAFKNEMIVAFGEFAKAVDLAGIARTVFKGLEVVLKALISVFSGIHFVVTTVVGAFRDLWNAASSGSDEALALLIGIGAVLTAVILPNILSLIGIIFGALIPALYRMAVAAWASGGPYAALLAAVIAISYGVIKIVKHWDQVKEAARAAWEGIKAGFSAAFAFIAELPIIKQLIWLVEKLDKLTGLTSASAVLTPDKVAQLEGEGAKIDQALGDVNAPKDGVWSWINTPGTASANKNVNIGPTTVNIYANDAEDAKRKFDADQVDRMNRHAAAALAR